MVPLPQLYFPILLLNQPLSFSYFLVPLSQIWAPGLDIQYITLTSHALQCCLNVRRMQSALIHCRSPWKPFFEVHSPATATKISLDPCGSPEWHFIFSFFLSRSFVSEWIFDGENSSRWLRGSCTEMKWSPSAADWGLQLCVQVLKSSTLASQVWSHLKYTSPVLHWSILLVVLHVFWFLKKEIALAFNRNWCVAFSWAVNLGGGWHVKGGTDGWILWSGERCRIERTAKQLWGLTDWVLVCELCCHSGS